MTDMDDTQKPSSPRPIVEPKAVQRAAAAKARNHLARSTSDRPPFQKLAPLMTDDERYILDMIADLFPGLTPQQVEQELHKLRIHDRVVQELLGNEDDAGATPDG